MGVGSFDNANFEKWLKKTRIGFVSPLVDSYAAVVQFPVLSAVHPHHK